MKTLRMLSWNVNGIRAVERKNALDWFFEEQPDILCLQEIKADFNQFPKRLAAVDGYHTFVNSADRKGYSGVALYTKEKPEEVETGLGIEKFDVEGRVILAHYKKFSLYNIYYPNGKASKERLKYKMDFYDAFLEHAENLRKQGRSVVFCGDVNTAHKEIDLARPKQNEKTSGFLPIERAWMDKVVEAGYIDTFRMFEEGSGHYSWWDMITRARERNVGWRIDYFFVSEDLRKKVKDAYILSDIMGSDHCPVGLDLKV